MLKLKPVLAALLLLGTAAPVAAQPAPPAAAPDGAQLTLAFSGIERPTGAIMIALFDSEAGWTGNRPVRTAMVPVSGASAEAVFAGLPPGRYGAKVFHDVNGDQRLNSNPFGIPIEPFAFSNNAHGSMGPARWADAAFDLAAGASRHAITVQ
ncbi:MAG TPA: DUF2141 domain-containing protein [Allosphingosinicella sp.]|nr:DUF2141 domain-containing protein [Allosphingosinicella sp.]